MDHSGKPENVQIQDNYSGKWNKKILLEHPPRVLVTPTSTVRAPTTGRTSCRKITLGSGTRTCIFSHKEAKNDWTSTKRGITTERSPAQHEVTLIEDKLYWSGKPKTNRFDRSGEPLRQENVRLYDHLDDDGTAYNRHFNFQLISAEGENSYRFETELEVCYQSFVQDFGPLNLAVIWRYCWLLDKVFEVGKMLQAVTIILNTELLFCSEMTTLRSSGICPLSTEHESSHAQEEVIIGIVHSRHSSKIRISAGKHPPIRIPEFIFRSFPRGNGLHPRKNPL